MPERVIDWPGIRAEWDAGQISMREIGRVFGVSPTSVTKRAEKERWPARPTTPLGLRYTAPKPPVAPAEEGPEENEGEDDEGEVSTPLTGEVSGGGNGERPPTGGVDTGHAREAPPGPNPAALASFERLIALILRHRVFMRTLTEQYALCIQDVIDLRARKAEANRPVTLKETQMIADVLQKASMSVGRLMPLERRAFGLSDADGPSEFDAMSPEDLQEIERLVRQALASSGGSALGSGA